MPRLKRRPENWPLEFKLLLETNELIIAENEMKLVGLGGWELETDSVSLHFTQFQLLFARASPSLEQFHIV